MTESYIDPKVAFKKLSVNKHFINLVATEFRYDMQGISHEANEEQYIDRMVICENKSRLRKNVDNLSLLKNKEFDRIKLLNPMHALHLILNGLQYNLLNSTTESKLTSFIITLYELRKKVEFEPRTNYLCLRGMFPTSDRINMQIARACFSQLDNDILYMYLVYLGNIIAKPQNTSRWEIINIILTGDSQVEAEMNPRYVSCKRSNSLPLLHDIPKFTRELGHDLMYNLKPEDITSFNLISSLMDNSFFLEWKNMSQLETLLSGHDLTNPKHCSAWESQLGMILPLGTWVSIPEDESLRIFCKRLKSYAVYFMSNLKDFSEFRCKPKNSFVTKSLAIQFMNDKEMYDKYPELEFGNTRRVFSYLCTKYEVDPSKSFFYVPRDNGRLVNGTITKLGYRNYAPIFNDMLFAWYRMKEGGSGKMLHDFPGFERFGDDSLLAVDEYTYSSYEWVTTTKWNAEVPLTRSDEQLKDYLFQPSDLISLYYILEDDGFYTDVQRFLMMQVIKPVMTRDSAMKLPLPYFDELTQTDKNMVLDVFMAIQHIASHMLTLQVPDAWPDRTSPCVKDLEEQLIICRRQLAHWLLKLRERYTELDKNLRSFVKNLSCYSLNDESASFIVMEDETVGDLLKSMKPFVVNIQRRMKPNFDAASLSLGDEPGDGGLKIPSTWASIEHGRYPVATELDIWVRSMSIPPSEMIATANFYLSIFGHLESKGMYTVVSGTPMATS